MCDLQIKIIGLAEFSIATFPTMFTDFSRLLFVVTLCILKSLRDICLLFEKCHCLLTAERRQLLKNILFREAAKLMLPFL